MIEFPAGILQAGFYVLRLKVRKLLEHLLLAQPVRQQVEDIDNTDAHAPDAGSPAALFRVNRYTIHR